MPTAPSKIVKVTVGTLFVLVAIGLIGAGMIRRWMDMAERERVNFLETLAQVRHATREDLEKTWGNKVTWVLPDDAGARNEPDRWRTAPVALAVMPRHPGKRFDCIFACFDGETVTALLGLTTVVGYFDGREINIRKHPATLIEPPLSAEELKGLRLLTELLEQRIRSLNPQSEQYGWTRTVLATARKLEQAG